MAEETANSQSQTVQMSIKDMREFIHNLGGVIDASPDAPKLRAAVSEALLADCVQCAIRLNGADLLSLNDESNRDPRLERLRIGYCSRNGCDCHYYAVTTVPHADLRWPALVTPSDVLHSTQTDEAGESKVRVPFKDRVRPYVRRTLIAVGALLLVFVIRQYYMGGSIPFIRQPEDFRVDRFQSQP